MTATDRARRTAEADALCGAAYDACSGPDVGVALVAVGGYGRGELAPHSDLDVVLVYDEGVDLGDLAEQVWYPLWDTGAKLDHSVRTLPQMLDQAGGDLRVALGLLDIRHLAGDPNLTLRLRTTMLAEWRRGPAAAARAADAGARPSRADRGARAPVGPTSRRPRAGCATRSCSRRSSPRGWSTSPTRTSSAVAARCSTCATWSRTRPAGPPTGSRRSCGPRGRPARTADALAAQVHVRRIGRRITHLSRLTWRRVDGVLSPDPAAPRRPVLTPLAPGVALSAGEVVLDGRARPVGGPAAAAACRRGRRRARRGAGAAHGRPAGPGVAAAARSLARRGPAAARAAARGRAGCCRSGRPSRRPARSTGSCPSGSGSGCCRTPRRSTASPSTGTPSRPASRRRA